MDLSGLGIAVKLKEKEKKGNKNPSCACLVGIYNFGYNSCTLNPKPYTTYIYICTMNPDCRWEFDA
jgi:hypothetical protein